MSVDTSYTPRTSWQVTKSVWHAMFMREALSRTMANRFAWFWQILEPSLFVLIFVAIRQVMGNAKLISGADFVPWLIVGFMVFLLFRSVMQKFRGAIEANKALFSYRQVLPVDPILVRVVLEGMLISVVFVVFLIGANLLNIPLVPDDALYVIFIWVLAWFFAAGWALILTVITELIDEIKLLVQVLMMPLLIISGVIFPINLLPEQLKSYLLLNPVLHLVELIRIGFFENYKALDGVNHAYVIAWTLALVALGLMLNLRFKDKVKAI